MLLQTKLCFTCRIAKSFSEFREYTKTSNICILCKRQHAKDWHTKNRETKNAKSREYIHGNKKFSAYVVAWQRKNRMKTKKYTRKARLKREYGLTLEDYQKMEEQQGGTCLICFTKSKKKYLSVDHCHETKKIRGLLCTNCNLGLGNFQDNLEFLKRAIWYLENAQEKHQSPAIGFHLP